MLIFEENGTCDQPVSTLVSHDEHWAETSLTGLNILLNLLSHSNVLFCGPASVRIHSLLDSRPLNSREEAACFLSNMKIYWNNCDEMMMPGIHKRNRQIGEKKLKFQNHIIAQWRLRRRTDQQRILQLTKQRRIH
ncbi:unnamed protein product [Rotaria socialis]|uniref:Uncharacterized protein n=1 Tax=Rotaria socialis TaxID=392032 RepID=A0A821R4W3_9BILA|nr:unnamed protein product [Rotaria socialis]CAF3658483.1 unnamed protein product [Rotaria socialis]CAF4296890.1 unnamed protein product [Rotaria socialis]CAF4370813.1 unnamed protein product [Rotaria socialis]CAF4535774.1 unnamed protein product [Rotaria socialis]